MGDGTTTSELRARLAGHLARRAGLEPHQVQARIDEARDDVELVESVVAGLVGVVEKAAVCWREVLGGADPPPLLLAVDVAACAAAAGMPAIALAGVDRIAEVVLTRDSGDGPIPGAHDPLRDDPLGAGALLERARDVALEVGHAPRAVALARAATALYERLGRRAEARHSLAGQARALRAAGNQKKARHQLERWREMAKEVGSASDEAAAIELLAENEALDGQVQSAAALLEEASKLHLTAGDVEASLRLQRRRARCLADEGALERAVDVLEKGVEQAKEAGLLPVSSDLALDLVRVQLLRGWLGSALSGAESLRKSLEDDPTRDAAALLHFAQGLLLAGDEPRALRTLAKLPPDLEESPSSGRSLRLRAELAANRGQSVEAGLLLLDAARVLRRWPETAAEGVEALLRRAELALDHGQPDTALEERRRVATLGVPPALELRHELLAARLAGPDERELLLEELWEGSTGATLLDRARVATALARLRIELGERASAAGPLKDALEELEEVRDGLPGSLKAGFPRSFLVRELVTVGRELAGTDAALDRFVASLGEDDSSESTPLAPGSE